MERNQSNPPGLLCLIQYSTQGPRISTEEVTTDDIVQGFNRWKETTSTSPSGRHLGHYKAILKDPMLLQCFQKFLSIALNSDIALIRWRNAINIMIEKDTGSPNLNRLRIIHLF
jgi:hypothetical protein